MKRTGFFIAVVMLAIAVFTAMPRFVQSSVASVYYITPNQKTYENMVNCTGTVESENVREVYLQSAIVPAQVYVAVGDLVDEGDVLVQVDRDLTQQLNSSVAGLLGPLSAVLPNSAQSVDWAQLAASYGLSDTLSMAGVDYKAVEDLLHGPTQPTSASIVGGDSPAQIISPMTGVVTRVDIIPEAPASSGKAIFTITDLEHYKVIAAVAENDIAKIEIGDKATVRGVGFAGSVYRGRIAKIHPTARRSLTGSETVVDVEISIENPDYRLKPGFSAKVEITGGNSYDLITVPYEAVRQDENNNEFVYVYRDGKIQKQVILTGQELTSEVEVLDGVDCDSIVVYNPGNMVKEGAMIHIKGRANQETGE